MIEPRPVRAFLAVPSPPAWVDSARNLVQRLRASLPEASWTKPESWHLTLLFLGEISGDAVRRFAAGIAPKVQACEGGDLQTGAAVVFPARGPARVLAVGFAPSAVTESLVALARDAHVLAADVVGSSDLGKHKEFHPHVTLARLRKPWPRESVDAFRHEVDAWRFPAWPVQRAIFYESRLERDGAIHTPMGEWSMAGSPERTRA
jgi:RNA 2',3'-cyclic 3'-phosphodiesterase